MGTEGGGWRRDGAELLLDGREWPAVDPFSTLAPFPNEIPSWESPCPRYDWLTWYIRLFQIQGDVLVLYVYQLKTDSAGNENVAVEKVSFRRNSGLAA